MHADCEPIGIRRETLQSRSKKKNTVQWNKLLKAREKEHVTCTGKRELREQGLCFERNSARGHLEDLVVEGRVSKWILNRMRLGGLDLIASGKEVESTC